MFRRAQLMTAQEKIASGLAYEGVKVHFGARIPNADVVTREIGLPPLPDEIDEAAEISLRSYLGHEVGHLKFKSAPWPAEIMKDKVVKELAFHLEDCRTDREMGKEFPGVKEDRRAGYDLLFPKLQVNNILKAAVLLTYEQVNEYRTLEDSIQAWALKVGDPQAAQALTMLIGAIDKQIKIAKRTESSAEVIAVSKEIKEIWKQHFKGQQGGDEGDEQNNSKMSDGGAFGDKSKKSDEKQKSKPKPKKSDEDETDENDEDENDENDEDENDEDENDEDETDENKGSKSKNEEAPDEGDESEGDEDEDAESEKSESADEEDSEDGEKSEAAEGDESDGGESEGESGDNSSTGEESDGEKDARVEKEMEDMLDDFESLSAQEKADLRSRICDDRNSNEHSGLVCPEGYRPYTGEDMVTSLDPVDAPASFRSDVRSKLGVMQRRLLCDLQSRRRLWVCDREHGEIDDTRLARVPTGDRRIYKRKLRRPALNIAVQVVLDMSASMRGSKMFLCGQLGYILGETLALVQVPYEVVGFTTGCANASPTEPRVPGVYYHRDLPLKLIEIKPFGMTRKSDMLNRFYAAALFTGGNTVEGEGVWWAAKRLAERPEQRKLLITICDGEPCGSPAPMHKFTEHAGNVVRRIRAHGIETIHVGICTDAPLRYVPEETFVRYDGLNDLLVGFYSQLGAILRGEKKRNTEEVTTS